MASLSSIASVNIPRLDGLGGSSIYGDFSATGDITGDRVIGTTLVMSPYISGTAVVTNGLTVSGDEEITGDITMTNYGSTKLYPNVKYTETDLSSTGGSITSIPSWATKITVLIRGAKWNLTPWPGLKIGKASGTFPWTSVNGVCRQTGSSALGILAVPDSGYSGISILVSGVTTTTGSGVHVVATFRLVNTVSNVQYWLVEGQTSSQPTGHGASFAALFTGPSNEVMDKIEFSLLNSPSSAVFSAGQISAIFE